ncbi:hypothetical protein [Anabaena sp. CCY 9402-a]|uniref:hypothetical protein n=1 Tax=Anabaena sp. CCY 9402-a TaxID=3103867 RepID=UPI0039C66F86
MSSLFSLHELSIVLLIHNQNPTLLNLDFLKYSGIVPQNWELANDPISTPNLSQVIFQNGLRIIADTNRTIFTERIAGKSLSDLVVAQVAKLYTQVLPHAEYKALGINPEGFATFPDHPEIAQNYLSKTLLSSQPWLEFGNKTPKVDLNISYTLDQGTLNLKVSQGFLRQENGEVITPIVTYSGNFEYIFQEVSPPEKLAVLSNHLEQWQLNLETFTNLIKNQFLKGLSTPLLGVGINTDPLMGEPIAIAMK